MKKEGVLILAVPCGAAVLFLAAALARPSAPAPNPKRATAAPVQRPPLLAPSHAPAAAIPRTAPGSELARATEAVRVYSAYQTYRTVVASGNPRLMDTVRPKDADEREAFVRYAEQEFAKAPDELGRSIALRTLDSLRR